MPTNAAGVTYTFVTGTPIPIVGTPTWNITITYPSGGGSTVHLTGIVKSNVLTTGSGSLGGLALIGNNTFVVAPGATANIGVGAAVLANTTIYVGGTATLDVVAAALSSSTIHVDGGSVSLAAGVVAGALGHTTVDLDNKGSLSVTPGLVSALDGSTINFGLNGGTAVVGGTADHLLDLSTTSFNDLDNTSDIIDDTTLGFGSGISSYTIAGAVTGTQTVTVHAKDGSSFSFQTAGSNLSPATYVVTGTAQNGPLHFSADGLGGTDITVCFLSGTRISTPDGEIAIESLKIGDLIVTADSRTIPVRWIGVNTVSTQFADPLRVLPIRIKAGALADNVPARDLLVSSEHAMFIDGVLVQAGAMVNGLSIIRETDMPNTFVYYHVEVGDHSLIMAEGAPTETFVDNVDRMSFDNWSEYKELYGDDISIHEMEYPRAQSARQVPSSVKALLAARKLAFVEEIAAAA